MLHVKTLVGKEAKINSAEGNCMLSFENFVEAVKKGFGIRKGEVDLRCGGILITKDNFKDYKLTLATHKDHGLFEGGSAVKIVMMKKKVKDPVIKDEVSKDILIKSLAGDSETVTLDNSMSKLEDFVNAITQKFSISTREVRLVSAGTEITKDNFNDYKLTTFTGKKHGLFQQQNMLHLVDRGGKVEKIPTSFFQHKTPLTNAPETPWNELTDNFRAHLSITTRNDRIKLQDDKGKYPSTSEYWGSHMQEKERNKTLKDYQDNKHNDNPENLSPFKQDSIIKPFSK